MHQTEPPTTVSPESHAASPHKLSRNVITLGWVSFFTDVASEMLYPIMPLFLTGTLGASPAILGLIDGVAEGGSSLLRWITGAISDRFRRRKPFVAIGYTLSAISKPIMGLAAITGTGWPMFFAGRASDRVGKSIRTSARDALIADSTAPEIRGKAFGLHRAMDTAGAVLGPLLALLVLWIWPQLPLYWLFFIALGPGVFSSLLAMFVVRDIPHPPGSGKLPPLFQSYPAAFWWLIFANALFSLGNSSDAFLILRSKEVGLSFTSVVLAFAVYNVVYALGSYPLGKWSDRIGRKPIICAGWLIYGSVYLGFAWNTSPAIVWPLMATYGLYQALTDGVTKAMMSDIVSKDRRAGAIGLFHTVSGIGQFGASIFAGAIWDWRIEGGMAPFIFGAACAIAAAVVIGMIRTRTTEN